MGCDNTKFRFPPGEEFGDTYNKYRDLDQQLRDIQRNQKNINTSDPIKALQALGQDLSKNMGNMMKLATDREEAFKKLTDIFNTQKESNTLGKDAVLKTNKYNGIIKERERDEREQKEQLKKLEAKMQNMMGRLRV